MDERLCAVIAETLTSRDFLTAEELLHELAQTGEEVDQRTLRFWTSRQLLPKPVKKPYRGADGRVGYYPREVLATIAKIRNLQAQGWKIKQIAAQLDEETSSAPRPNLDQAKFFAEKYLKSLLVGRSQIERKSSHYARANQHNETAVIRQDLVARLERMVPRKVAVAAASSFLLSLNDKQRRRLARRLRLSSKESSRPEPTEPNIADQFSDDNLVEVKEALKTWPELLDSNGSHLVQPVVSRRARALTIALKDCLERYLSSTTLGRSALMDKMSEHLAELRKISQQIREDLSFLRETDSKR